MSFLVVRPLAPAALRLAAVAGIALVLGACADTTAPSAPATPTTAEAARPTLSPKAPALAQLPASTGRVGGVATPYPSVSCGGAVAGINRSVFVYGATVSPATGIISSSQYVVGDVFLKRYTKAGWVTVNIVRTKSGSMSGGVQIVGMTDRATLPNVFIERDASGQALPAGYYSVQTRMSWMNDAYSNGFYANVGEQWVNYSDRADYAPTSTFGQITTGAGWCYIY